MKCPNCSRENEQTNTFCIFCGTRLIPISPEPQESPLQSMEEEVQRLRTSIQQINERLSFLEQKQGVTVQPRIQVTQPAAIQKVTTKPQEIKPQKTPGEWEQILGGNWLARIGVLALLFGIGFFLKYAFDRNWILPVIRVLLGVVTGFIMLGGGYLWRKKYPVLTQVLTGGGIGVMYLAIFASYTPYDLIPFYAVVALLLIICIGSVVLALRYDSMALAILGIIGAFIAPFVLGVFETGSPAISGASNGYPILVYTIVINVGVLLISTFRNWRWFTLLALLLSLIVFGVWYENFWENAGIVGAEINLTIIFLIFVAATTLFHIIWKRTPQPFDYAMMVINASGYSAYSLSLLWSDYHAWTGAFTFLLALFYTGLGYFILKRGIANLRLSLFAFGIAIVLLTIAFPIQFGDRAWTTIAWAAEGVVLLWLSIRFPIQVFRWAGYTACIITAFRLLFFDTAVRISDYTPVINERFLAFLFVIASSYLTGYLLVKMKAKLNEQEARFVIPTFFIAANFFTLWLFSAEIWSSFDHSLHNLSTSERLGDAGNSLRNFQNLSITGLWAFYAVIALVVGIAKRIRFLRLGALALLLIAIGKVFAYDVFRLEMVYRIVAFVGLGILLLASGYLYQRYSKRIREFLIKE